ncbi:hypothetical protein EIN_428720 [Entamoeba invadens IP1]|uniref:Nucleoplasmin-like domain-containing protein n=1 Tax=Entamoeba invadens IP1 TaxID=370355 RepID=A0A0A1UEW7_ENTIV|nr:hypothetical protein EIN_428720 [Entamoeba invadens IP1]ELP95146.1 hypothetical protein EIN_428720 [Entamoeba invadens IP1]|eukprot:XP_004261917.1 hypothetical protein EIN_428720 [Entamoeba invadens IP1]
MFWSLVVKPNEKTEFKTGDILHITNAMLVTKTKTELKQRSQLSILCNQTKTLIVSFIPGHRDHTQLDLVIAKQNVVFLNTGIHSIHLSGYITKISQEENAMEEDDEELPALGSDNEDDEELKKKEKDSKAIKKPKEKKPKVC